MALARTLERTVVAMLAATVVAFAAGSTIIDHILLYGRPARWYCLGGLFLLALAYAAAAGRRRSLPIAFLAVGASLVVVALTSALWSVDPVLTLKRAATFAALFAAAGGLVAGSRGRDESIRRLLLGLLVGIAIVAVAGLFVLWFTDVGVQSASFEYPARYRGFGQNPDTASALLALGVPLATFFALEARSWIWRGAAIAVALFFAGSIAASGSRAAMVAAFVGSLVVALGAGRGWRLRLAVAGGAAVVFGASVGASQIPKPLQPQHAAPPARVQIRSYQRTLLSSGGRLQAWEGAIDQAANRPVAGYGFGTEQLAFVDRYLQFDSALPENSYIGAALQLGLVGLVLLLALAVFALGAYARSAFQLPSSAAATASACAGAFIAALTIAVTQSYLFSVGNIVTASAWISAFLLAAVVWAAPRGAVASGRARLRPTRAPRGSRRERSSLPTPGSR